MRKKTQMDYSREWKNANPERALDRGRVDNTFQQLKKIINSGDRDAQERAEAVALRWLERRLSYKKNWA